MPDPDAPKTTFLGKFVILLFLIGCGYGAWYFFSRPSRTNAPNPTTPPGSPATAGSNTPTPTNGAAVTIGIAYGTEKKRWLEWAVTRFAATSAGAGVSVNLIPFGSLEAAQALIGGDQRITAWTPASTLYRDSFEQDWQLKFSIKPFLRAETLALTPMVFVWWNERYQAFISKYPAVSFATIGQALRERGGWDALAGKPEWGLFKFGHTHPNQSNSGLVTLVSMAYEHTGKDRGLTLKDILDPGFQAWMGQVETSVSSLSNSTGNLMKEMVLKGPSAFDAVFVYESVAIDYLKNAEGRWGELRIVYPPRNLWNDNPYYLLDAPWSSAAQKQAAGAFCDYLLSEPAQRQALVHGFRPGNPAVPVLAPDSPFTVFTRYGLKNDLTAVVELPPAEVLTNLLASWQRTVGSR